MNYTTYEVEFLDVRMDKKQGVSYELTYEHDRIKTLEILKTLCHAKDCIDSGTLNNDFESAENGFKILSALYTDEIYSCDRDERIRKIKDVYNNTVKEFVDKINRKFYIDVEEWSDKLKLVR